MLALHLLQSALVHVNTLLLQHLLAEPRWRETLTDVDRRALTPLFWSNVNPYGRFRLDMDRHLDLDLDLAPAGLPGGALLPRMSVSRISGYDAGTRGVVSHKGIPLRDTQPIRVVHSKAGDEFGSATASNRVKAIGIDWSY